MVVDISLPSACRAKPPNASSSGTGKLAKIMTTALEGVDLFGAHVRHQALQGRVLLEEVLEVVAAVLGAEGLELTVGRRRQLAQQRVFVITGEQGVPLRTPQHLDHVVQAFTGSQGQAGGRLRLVHLAIAKHSPDMPGRGVEQPAMMQVAHEARLIDRIERADAHGTCGKLPEVRHQPRVRIGAQPVAADLLPAWLARTTMARAFQRRMPVIRSSSSRSPG
ncbi:hypothetical protein WR25_17416 [Diploscapter pachys]|uniref:Uncharacterized protein n=1 Tax=Diploscapter pachys TaxID=2018661 RepID=A0A2A2K529_9BILA|nr:hypothetical protein WR25_17416 [Diploscapter pachys]